MFAVSVVMVVGLGLLFASGQLMVPPVLYEAGDYNYVCKGHSIELEWKYISITNRFSATWSWRLSETDPWVTIATGQVVDGREPGDLQWVFEVKRAEFVGRLKTESLVGLVIGNARKSDAGLYRIYVTEPKADRFGATTLVVYEGCPDVSGVQFSVSCPAIEGPPGTLKTDEFTYGDQVHLTLTVPRATPPIIRRFYYHEKQHLIFQQPIIPRCYLEGKCGDGWVKWNISESSMTVAFYETVPYAEMFAVVKLYYRKAFWNTEMFPFKLVNPNVRNATTLHCKNTAISVSSVGISLIFWSLVAMTTNAEDG